jgi:hypothetical protein
MLDGQTLTGPLNGTEITFKNDSFEYKGTVAGDRMQGTVSVNGRTQRWSATKRR